jgi:hypothetical protein
MNILAREEDRHHRQLKVRGLQRLRGREAAQVICQWLTAESVCK